jgi:hypothetical protein
MIQTSFLFMAEDPETNFFHLGRKIDTPADAPNRDPEEKALPELKRLNRESGLGIGSGGEGRFLGEKDSVNEIAEASIRRRLRIYPPESAALTNAPSLLMMKFNSTDPIKLFDKKVAKVIKMESGDHEFVWNTTLKFWKSVTFSGPHKLPTFSRQFVEVQPELTEGKLKQLIPKLEFTFSKTTVIWEQLADGSHAPKSIDMVYHDPSTLTLKNNSIQLSLDINWLDQDDRIFEKMFDETLFGLILPPIAK